MQIISWPPTKQEQDAALARAPMVVGEELPVYVGDLLKDIRTRGDDALRDMTLKFDRVALNKFLVSDVEKKAAFDALAPALRTALETAKANIEKFHNAQRPKDFRMETMAGVSCGQTWRPLQNIGLYVPGGTAPLFSSVLMMAVPAKLAGCARVIMCAPPQKDGKINRETLAAAYLCGVEEVYALGGVAAIGAMAYGTQTIAKVEKICGPGNAYVTMAKQIVSQQSFGAAIDMPAGPSEVMVVADSSCRADWVAADMLAQAEHDTAAQAVLVTTDPAFAQKVAQEVEKQAQTLSRRAILDKSLTIARALVAKEDSVLEIVNRYAPEHLILSNEKDASWIDKVTSAGSIFVGPYTPETAGDYASGTNHVLPTYGAARAYAGINLLSFMRSMTVQSLTPDGLKTLGPLLVLMAEAEGLDGHAAAVSRRLETE